jgi:hypothetical protein
MAREEIGYRVIGQSPDCQRKQQKENNQDSHYYGKIAGFCTHKHLP